MLVYKPQFAVVHKLFFCHTNNHVVSFFLIFEKVVVKPSPMSSSAAMDMASSGTSIRQRLGKKVSLPVVSSTTDDGESPAVRTGK